MRLEPGTSRSSLCSSCCTKVLVLPHHASSGWSALDPCSPSNLFQNCHNCFQGSTAPPPGFVYLAQILPRYTLLRFLRSSSSITISAPFRKTSMATSKSFSSTASRVWNKLLSHVSSALALPVFRRHLKHHFTLMPTLVSLYQPSELKLSCRHPNAFPLRA